MPTAFVVSALSVTRLIWLTVDREPAGHQALQNLMTKVFTFRAYSELAPTTMVHLGRAESAILDLARHARGSLARQYANAPALCAAPGSSSRTDRLGRLTCLSNRLRCAARFFTVVICNNRYSERHDNCVVHRSSPEPGCASGAHTHGDGNSDPDPSRHASYIA